MALNSQYEFFNSTFLSYHKILWKHLLASNYMWLFTHTGPGRMNLETTKIYAMCLTRCTCQYMIKMITTVHYDT